MIKQEDGEKFLKGKVRITWRMDEDGRKSNCLGKPPVAGSLSQEVHCP